MSEDATTRYGPLVGELTAEERLDPLGPGTPNRPVGEKLARLTPTALLAPRAVVDLDAAKLCLAGLWLYHDFLDDSHRISQDVDTPSGSFWHGIMHRREPDAGNSKYWFRRVGAHPVLSQLVSQTSALGYRYVSPFEFVDFCERVRGTRTPEEDLARRVQLVEWRLLFEHCFAAAVHPPG